MADEREARERERERYEDEGRRQELARREWMPAPLGGRVVLALGGGRALHTGSGNGLPGIATAEWWLPEVPRESLTLAFAHPSIGLAGSAVVDARGWAAEIAAHAIRIG